MPRRMLWVQWSEVARRHDLMPRRKAAREGRLVLPAEEEALFVPVVIGTQDMPVVRKPGGCSVTIKIGGAVVRAEVGVDARWLTEVLRAVKAAT